MPKCWKIFDADIFIKLAYLCNSIGSWIPLISARKKYAPFEVHGNITTVMKIIRNESNEDTGKDCFLIWQQSIKLDVL